MLTCVTLGFFADFSVSLSSSASNGSLETAWQPRQNEALSSHQQHPGESIANTSSDDAPRNGAHRVMADIGELRRSATCGMELHVTSSAEQPEEVLPAKPQSECPEHA